MINFTNGEGISTGWLQNPPTKKQLEKLNIEQLIIIAKRKRGLKQTLLNFLNENSTTIKI